MTKVIQEITGGTGSRFALTLSSICLAASSLIVYRGASVSCCDQVTHAAGWVFRLEIEGKGDVWLRDQKVRLQHVDTGGYLHSHDKKYSRIVAGQQEVSINTL